MTNDARWLRYEEPDLIAANILAGKSIAGVAAPLEDIES